MQNLIKYTLLFLALMLCNAVLRAQQDRVYLPWDLSKTAGFPGGLGAFYTYFRTTQIYPADTSIRPAGNRLILSFVVEPDGSASDFRVFETPGPDFTEAVRRALDAVRWNSAEANGHSVRQMMILYFFFHHGLRNVEVREGGLDIWNYSTLSDIAPEDYKNINFPSQPVFMGYYPEDSLSSKKQYPESKDLRLAFSVRRYVGFSDIMKVTTDYTVNSTDTFSAEQTYKGGHWMFSMHLVYAFEY